MIRSSQKTLGFISILLVTGALFGVLFVRFVHRTPTNQQGATVQAPSIRFGGAAFTLTLAETTAEQERGLSGTTSLPEGAGMLFVFPQPDRYGFWMKDMQYPIDIVWLDGSYKVVDITERFDPSSYPQVVYPSLPAVYVLEIGSGIAKQSGISVGSQAVFQKN